MSGLEQWAAHADCRRRNQVQLVCMTAMMGIIAGLYCVVEELVDEDDDGDYDGDDDDDELPVQSSNLPTRALGTRISAVQPTRATAATAFKSHGPAPIQTGTGAKKRSCEHAKVQTSNKRVRTVDAARMKDAAQAASLAPRADAVREKRPVSTSLGKAMPAVRYQPETTANKRAREPAQADTSFQRACEAIDRQISEIGTKMTELANALRQAPPITEELLASTLQGQAIALAVEEKVLTDRGRAVVLGLFGDAGVARQYLVLQGEAKQKLRALWLKHRLFKQGIYGEGLVSMFSE